MMMSGNVHLKMREVLGLLNDEFGGTSEESENLHFFQSLVEFTNNPIAACNAAGEVVYVNPAFTRLFGYNQGDFDGLQFVDICSDESREIIMTDVMPYLGSGSGWEGELCTRGRNGDDIIIWGRFDSVLDSNKQVILGMIIIQDITERKKMEDTWQEYMKKLSSSERLAATGRLAASITHEINNPLQALSLNLDFVKQELPDNFSEISSLQQIEISLGRIRETVNQLLDLHRSKINVHEDVDLHQVLQTTLNLLKNQLMIRGITVIKYLSSQNPLIKGVKPDLYHVFMNIILNAHDAMDSGGTLQIRTYVKGNSVNVEFQDTGAGIHESDLETIFDPFFTTKSDKSGTGLGLSTTKSSVESFGGTISVKSEVGMGSLFKLQFPIADYLKGKN